jgi:hypothetical protein
MIEYTERRPCRSTSSSTLSSLFPRRMGEDPVRRSRSFRRRAGLRRVCHPPAKSISSVFMPCIVINGKSHTAGTLSLSACDEAASVVTLRRAEVRGEAKTLRRNGGAMLLRTARENMIGVVRGKRGDIGGRRRRRKCCGCALSKSGPPKGVGPTDGASGKLGHLETRRWPLFFTHKVHSRARLFIFASSSLLHHLNFLK